MRYVDGVLLVDLWDERVLSRAVRAAWSPLIDDVYALSRRCTKTALLDLAREVDSGFDVRVFVDMLRHLARYGDVDLALGDVDIVALRAFFQQWMTELDLGAH
jgi:hypothetical protein